MTEPSFLDAFACVWRIADWCRKSVIRHTQVTTPHGSEGRGARSKVTSRERRREAMPLMHDGGVGSSPGAQSFIEDAKLMARSD